MNPSINTVFRDESIHQYRIPNLYAAQEYNVFRAVYMAVRCQMGRKYNLFLAQTQCILKHFLWKN